MKRLNPFWFVGLLLAASLVLWAALPATEAFTGADSTDLVTHNGSWTYSNSGDWEIVSNQGRCAQGTGDGIAYWNADSFDADQYSQAVVKVIGSGNSMGLMVRVNGASMNNGYGFTWYPDKDHIFLKRYTSGSGTDLDSASSANLQVDDVIRLEADGNHITAKVNGSIVLGPETDANYATGVAGITCYATNGAAIDDWEGGNLAVAGRRNLTLFSFGSPLWR